eukprot:scaffold1290_cov248-Ochromonas_danica.AAC.5
MMIVIMLLILSVLLVVSVEDSSFSILASDRKNSRKFITPEEFDVFLTDLQGEEMKKIANVLKVGYNLPMPKQHKATFPVAGILYGEYGRPIFPLEVQHLQTTIQTLFVYDSTCPYIYLSASTLAALNIVDLVLPSMNIVIHGMTLPVHPSTGHFKDINVLGQSFLTHHHADLMLRSKDGVAYMIA